MTCRYLSGKFQTFKECLNSFYQGNTNIAKISELIANITDLKNILLGVKKNSERQIELKTLSKSQKNLYTKTEVLRIMLNDTKICNGDEKIFLWNFPETFKYKSEDIKPCFENEISYKNINEILTQIIEIFENSCHPSNIFKIAYNYLFEKTIAHIDYVFFFYFTIKKSRVELEFLYHGEQIWISTQENLQIDAMFLRKNTESSTRDIPTVLFCNPNAGYYEYSAEFQDQWMEFYANRNFNIMIWNYPGYGRSQGKPTPDRILNSAECVYKYLREERGIKKLVIHGESLGGAVACHLASKFGCDLLFADRTFSSIDKVAEISVGKYPKKILNLLTGWKLESTKNYLNCHSYKLIGNDPCDGTIHELASLKTDVGNSAIQDNENTHILNSTEFNGFYEGIKLLNEAVQWSSKMPKNDNDDKRIVKLKSPNQENEIKNNNENIIEPPSTQKDRTNELVIIMPKNNSSARAIQISVPQPESYTKLTQSGDDFIAAADFSKKCIKEMEELDSAGLTLSRIIKDKKYNHLELLKTFLINIDVWGSFPPSKIESSYQPLRTLLENRTKAYVFFSFLLPNSINYVHQ